MITKRSGRHFPAENPQGSDLWNLPIWKLIAKMLRVVSVIIHQCMLGLRGPRSGLPIEKPTEIRASHEALVDHLQIYQLLTMYCDAGAKKPDNNVRH